jgi:hypothetical protein
MTGFISGGFNPLSAMTVRSFDDLGYTSNPAGADGYSLALGSLSAGGGTPSALTASPVWERPPNVRIRGLPTYPPYFAGSQ